MWSILKVLHKNIDRKLRCISKVNIFKLRDRNESLNESGNDNGIRMPNCQILITIFDRGRKYFTFTKQLKADYFPGKLAVISSEIYLSFSHETPKNQCINKYYIYNSSCCFQEYETMSITQTKMAVLRLWWYENRDRRLFRINREEAVGGCR